jgi:uncharacterized protein (TIGR03437 family)
MDRASQSTRLFLRPFTHSRRSKEMKQKLSCSFAVALALLAVWARPAAAADLRVSKSSLAFISSAGSNPATQTFTAFPSVAGTPFNPTVTAATTSGGNWLAVDKFAGGSFSTALTVVVKVESAALPAGAYTGQVTVTEASLSGSPAVIPVSLTVAPPGPFLVASQSAISVAALTGQNPAAQFLSLHNAGSGGILTPTFSATTASGGNWLAVSAPTASSMSADVTVRIDITSSSLAQGFYQGTITATAAGASNSPLNIPVGLRVGSSGGPVLALSPASIAFVAAQGANPASVTLNINNTGDGLLTPSVAAATVSGGDWLRVTLGAAGSGGSRPATVSAVVTGLAKGEYAGSLTITDPFASNSPQTVPVTLTIRDPSPVLSLGSRTVNFSTAVGAFRNTQNVTVNNAGIGALAFTAAASTTTGGAWLTVTPTSGNAPATLAITADSTGLAAGVYSGKVTVTVPGATPDVQSPQDIAVTLAVGIRTPTLNSGGIVNGASFVSQVVAPGAIVSAFGVDLGPAEGALATLVGGKLPTELSGTSLTFDTTKGPLFYVGAMQINVQVPWEMAGKASTMVQVSRAGLNGPQVQLTFRDADPGIFIAGGRPAILNQSARQVLPAEPAAAGEVLTLYATGLGLLDAAAGQVTGQPFPQSPLYNTRTRAAITVGSRDAEVLYSGVAPNFVGLYQVNFRVPAGLTAGDQPLILAIGTIQTAPVQLAVR